MMLQAVTTVSSADAPVAEQVLPVAFGISHFWALLQTRPAIQSAAGAQA